MSRTEPSAGNLGQTANWVMGGLKTDVWHYKIAFKEVRVLFSVI